MIVPPCPEIISPRSCRHQNLQAQRDIEDLKQKVLTEVEEASSMGKRAEAEQKGRQEAAERAEQCEKRLDAKMSEAQVRSEDPLPQHWSVM